MTREEFSKIAARLALNWDNIGKGKLELFYDKFGALPPALWAQIVNRVVDTEIFPPVVATLKKHLLEILQPCLPDAAEQWPLVHRAIRRASYHSTEDFASMPEIVQRCVGSADILKAWGMSEDFNEEVARANFIKAYNRIAEQRVRDIQAANTPEDLCRIAVKQFGDGRGLPQIGTTTPPAEEPANEGPREIPPDVAQKIEALKAGILAQNGYSSMEKRKNPPGAGRVE